MKKIFCVMLSAIVFGIAISASAQSIVSAETRSLVTSATLPFYAFGTLKEDKGNDKSYKAVNASYKAKENLLKHYKNGASATWFVGQSTIVAYMNSNDNQTRVVYNKKGTLLHVLKSYSADELDANVKKDIKYAFPEYNITTVQEVEEGANHFYIVKVESEKHFKDVVWFNNEVGVCGEYDRQSQQ